MKKINSNKGFSYVEMIIVIAISAIVFAMVTITIGTVNRNNIGRTSEQLEALVNRARTNALTKGTNHGWMNVTKIGNSYYGSVGLLDNNPQSVKKNGEKLATGNVSIIIQAGGDQPVTEGVVRHIGFKQNTGGILAGGVTVSVRKGTKKVDFDISELTGKVVR